MPDLRSIIFFAVSVLFASGTGPTALAQLSAKQKSEAMESFEVVWRTVRDHHPDPTLNGLDWQAIHLSTKPVIAQAQSMEDVRTALNEMLAKLSASHYAIIPSGLYNPLGVPNHAPPSDGSSANTPVVIERKAVVGQPVPPDVSNADDVAKHMKTERTEPVGKLVTFGNLPEQRVFFESRTLPSGAGYIRFNEFLDPVSLMPQFEDAVKRFADSPGIVLDLRGNPGGIGIMAMGIAGFFIDKSGQRLGEMKMRETTLKFVIFPRPETYRGRLAILLDAVSASTAEILAQGLQDLGRARIFGTRSAGAALPSDIIRLPDGDGFQYAQASYTSEKGRVLEGNGVTPDVEVRPSQKALLSGHDIVIETAETWIAELLPVPVRR